MIESGRDSTPKPTPLMCAVSTQNPETNEFDADGVSNWAPAGSEFFRTQSETSAICEASKADECKACLVWTKHVVQERISCLTPIRYSREAASRVLTSIEGSSRLPGVSLERGKMMEEVAQNDVTKSKSGFCDAVRTQCALSGTALKSQYD